MGTTVGSHARLARGPWAPLATRGVLMGLGVPWRASSLFNVHVLECLNTVLSTTTRVSFKRLHALAIGRVLCFNRPTDIAYNRSTLKSGPACCPGLLEY